MILSTVLNLFLIWGNCDLQDQYNLEVEVKKIQSATGSIMLAVYSPEQVFLSYEPYAGIQSPVVAKGSQVIKLELPLGEYAISLYHDANSDNELNTNFLGIPSENYGFSNDAMGLFGPPDYQKAKFNFGENGQRIVISLK